MISYCLMIVAWLQERASFQVAESMCQQDYSAFNQEGLHWRCQKQEMVGEWGRDRSSTTITLVNTTTISLSTSTILVFLTAALDHQQTTESVSYSFPTVLHPQYFPLPSSLCCSFTIYVLTEARASISFNRFLTRPLFKPAWLLFESGLY